MNDQEKIEQIHLYGISREQVKFIHENSMRFTEPLTHDSFMAALGKYLSGGRHSFPQLVVAPFYFRIACELVFGDYGNITNVIAITQLSSAVNGDDGVWYLCDLPLACFENVFGTIMRQNHEMIPFPHE